MAFKLIESSGRFISIRISSELKKAELDQMQTIATEFIKREGKIRIMIILENFLGWERGADWEDMSFQLSHDRDIEKIAIVGDEKWRNLALAFSGRSFRPVAIEFFNPSQLDQARTWIL